MFPFIVFLWTLLFASCFGTVYPPLTSSTLPYQKFPITGTHTGLKRDGGELWPARRNIDDLVNDVPQWSLFVQAFTRFQQLPESRFNSYFEISGIHGRPYYAWNSSPQAPGSPTTGYCSILFLAWHRPYIALFEQELASIAQDLVGTYQPSMQATWQVAANQFRLPYWDWARSPGMPAIVSQPTVQIINNNGQNETVTNPLYQYAFQRFPMNETWFPPGAPDGWLANYPQTMRGVSTKGGPSNPALVNAYLNYFDLQKSTWYALTRNTGLYNNFSTTATQGISLEAVHNNVHASIGAFYGHMSLLSYSAFDPLFWLHHSNVDRLYALWQAMNPDSWITPSTEPAGTFALSHGTAEDSSTPLEPFAPSGGDPYYTPDTSRLPNTFGYTYPEIPDWSVPAPVLAAQVTAQVHTLYNPTSQFKRRRGGNNTSQSLEWFVRTQVNKFDLHGERFSIHIFIGHASSNPSHWFSSPNKVGSMTVFTPPHKDGTPFPDIPAHSEFSLVEALNKQGLREDDIAAVSKYLKEHLHWRVQTFEGLAVDISQLPSLVISVQTEIVTYDSDNTELPTYSDIAVIPNVTKGKKGGFSG